jgi:hypothetical protein
VEKIRQAISPRFATKSLLILGDVDEEEDVVEVVSVEKEAVLLVLVVLEEERALVFRNFSRQQRQAKGEIL